MRRLATLALLLAFGFAYGQDKPQCDTSSGPSVDARCFWEEPSTKAHLATGADRNASSPSSWRDEQFCPNNAKDEIGLRECLVQQADYADRDLKQTYKKAMTQLSAAEKNALRRDERTWIKWREAECTKQAKDAEDCIDGCGDPWAMHVVCMTKEANNRVDALKAKWTK